MSCKICLNYVELLHEVTSRLEAATAAIVNAADGSQCDFDMVFSLAKEVDLEVKQLRREYEAHHYETHAGQPSMPGR